MSTHTRYINLLIAAGLATVCSAPGSSGLTGDRYLQEARSLKKTRHYQQAVSVLLQAVRASKASGDVHLLDCSLEMLSQIYAKQKQFSKAEESLRILIELRERTLWPEHPFVTDARHQLEDVYRALGNQSELQRLFKRDLAVDEKVLGQEDPETLKDLLNLAETAQARGSYAEADRLFKLLLTHQGLTIGPKNRLLQRINCGLGQNYFKQHKFAEAEIYFKKAALHSQASNDSLNQSYIYLNLGNSQYSQRKYNEAEQSLKRALPALLETTEPANQEIASIWEKLTVIKIQQQDLESARGYLKKAIDRRRLGVKSSNDDILLKALRDDQSWLLRLQGETKGKGSGHSRG